MNRPEPEQRDLFAIADLAREFGISARAIRFYESKGLLTPERVGNTRIFRRREVNIAAPYGVAIAGAGLWLIAGQLALSETLRGAIA